MKIEEKKKPYSSATVTTGDPKVNVDHFNKMLAGKEVNTHTDGYMNGTIRPGKAAENAAKAVGTFASQSPDGASSISTGGESSGGCCESLNESIEQYNDYIGKTIKIISIGDDPAADRYEGKTGIVEDIKLDGYGDVQLWGTWGGIALYPEHDIIEIIGDENMNEATHAKFAKPEGDRIAAFNNALAYAKKYNKPFIYGYTNKRYHGKFFALEQPIKCDKDMSDCEKDFRKKYRDCLVMYVAYPNKARIDYNVKQNAYDPVNEQFLYVTKLNKQIEIPDHIHILNRNAVEDAVRKIQPFEEFTVGYVTPIRYYSELDDLFNLVKCTELRGTTGEDYIEVRADDRDKEDRLKIAANAENIKDTGKHLDRNPYAGTEGDFSAQYSQVNKTVKQHWDIDHDGLSNSEGGKFIVKDADDRFYETILFYPVVGSKPKVVYYIDWKDGFGFEKISRDDLENKILNFVHKNATQIMQNTKLNKDGTHRALRWNTTSLSDKIEKQLISDASTLSSVKFGGEETIETRSKLSNSENGGVYIEKPQVRALYTNQIYYIKTPHETLGSELHESLIGSTPRINECLQTDTRLTWFIEDWEE